MYAPNFSSGDTEALQALWLAKDRKLGNDFKARLLPSTVLPSAGGVVEARLRAERAGSKHSPLWLLLLTVRGYVSKGLLANNFEGLASLK